jgi:hypothetical protein
MTKYQYLLPMIIFVISMGCIIFSGFRAKRKGG